MIKIKPILDIWTHERQLISHPQGRAMRVLLWGFVQKIDNNMTLYLIIKIQYRYNTASNSIQGNQVYMIGITQANKIMVALIWAHYKYQQGAFMK